VDVIFIQHLSWERNNFFICSTTYLFMLTSIPNFKHRHFEFTKFLVFFLLSFS